MSLTLVARVVARFAASKLEPPNPLPGYIPADSTKRPVLVTQPDGIEITGPLWQDGGGSTPSPQLSFGLRPGPKWKGKGYKGGGAGYLALHPDPEEPGTFWVGQVTVMPKFQRRGLATELYREAAKWLRQHGGKLRQGMITSEAAEKMWKKWRDQGLAEGKYLNLDKWAKIVAPQSVKAKPGKSLAQIPGRGKFVVEPYDGDDTFPPAIDTYEVVDGWVLYHGTNGSEGVVGGPQRNLDQWVKDVEKFKTLRKDYGHAKAELWSEAHGGEALVKASVGAAKKMLALGGAKAEIRVWVEPGKEPNGSASGNILNLANVHQSGTIKFIGGISLPIGEAIASHEAAHIVFSHKSGRNVIDVLKKRAEDGLENLSVYHALAGHFEGTMEAAALFTLAPARLESVAPDVFEAVKQWLG